VETGHVERLVAGRQQAHADIEPRRSRRAPQGLTQPWTLHTVRTRTTCVARGTIRTDGRAVIEGVEVSTDHLIAGLRVPTAERFDDVSPIDEQTLAAVARGDAAAVGQAGAGGR